MPTKIKLIRGIEFMQTSPEGEIDFEKSKQMLINVATAKRPPADFDVLLDLRRVQWKLSTSEIYLLAAKLSKYGNTFRDKVAVLVLPGTDFDQAEFFELCAKNRGFNIDCFTNYEDAVQWFFESDDSTTLDNQSNNLNKGDQKTNP